MCEIMHRIKIIPSGGTVAKHLVASAEDRQKYFMRRYIGIKNRISWIHAAQTPKLSGLHPQPASNTALFVAEFDRAVSGK